MRFYVRTICVVSIGLMLASNAWAQSLRVGYVDMKRVLDNAPQVVAGREQLDQEFRSRSEAIEIDEFRVKTLEDRGSLVSRYGQVAIGVLVMQDIAAVIFLAISAGKLPSVWAVGLLALIPGRHILGFILSSLLSKRTSAVKVLVMGSITVPILVMGTLKISFG